jgi:hypothetical protein
VSCNRNIHRHANYNFKAVDYVSLRLDVVIWLVCLATAPPLSHLQLFTALCCIAALLALAVHWLYPATYMQHRTAITTARRMLTLPSIRHFANRGMHPSGSLAAVVLHLLVQSGALLNAAGSLFFLDEWRVGKCCAAQQRECLQTAYPHAASKLALHDLRSM